MQAGQCGNQMGPKLFLEIVHIHGIGGDGEYCGDNDAQLGRINASGSKGLRMHVGSALRPRSEARCVPPLPKGMQKKNLLA